MKGTVLLGRGSGYAETPWQQLEHHLAQIPARHGNRSSFVSQDHHRVRDYAVTQLAHIGVPLSPECISQDLNRASDRVKYDPRGIGKESLGFIANQSRHRMVPISRWIKPRWSRARRRARGLHSGYGA